MMEGVSGFEEELVVVGGSREATDHDGVDKTASMSIFAPGDRRASSHCRLPVVKVRQVEAPCVKSSFCSSDSLRHSARVAILTELTSG